VAKTVSSLVKGMAKHWSAHDQFNYFHSMHSSRLWYEAPRFYTILSEVVDPERNESSNILYGMVQVVGGSYVTWVLWRLVKKSRKMDLKVKSYKQVKK
jgi:hypothetical protein